MRKLLLMFILFSPGILAPAANAASWPTKPLRLIVPYTAGGPTDGVARLIAQHLEENLGQAVVVQNRPGAGGAVGVGEVLRAAPDGYTLALVAPGPVAGLPALQALPYKLSDIQYIAGVARYPSVISVGAKSAISTLQQLVDTAKKAPGTLNYSSAGNGTTPHIGAELFRQEADIDTLHIPYKGAAPATTALLAGEVQYEMSDLAPVLPFHRAGKLKVLAVAGKERLSQLPDVPTTVESGLPAVIMETLYGLIGPAGIDKTIIERLGQAVTDVTATEHVRQFLYEQGGAPANLNDDQYRQTMMAEFNKWKRVAEKGDIKLN
ncbi:MAG: Bug family tripartite tricarboxylate transporter substrate binding protein [Advenella sp.]|uniref:Tripartite tricarboxylate transporter substrate binding protein n=1 Tax=Advenella kashmirensis TaxID=310575 RepID=A0A356LGU2_9BURK|nr:tripartite tricarboxylate transporter substrate binding protein [Advenella sp. FME57]HBP29988.1 tripartite tricarboxylate transporter substrate binding protein [Advenella kashmirensis]